LGILASPRNRFGFHAKNNRVGSTATILNRLASLNKPENRKAGTIVRAGRGEMSVGAPEPKSPNPIEAGTIKPIPQTSVTNRLVNCGGIGNPDPMTHHGFVGIETRW
jgi:hypothetical protein